MEYTISDGKYTCGKSVGKTGFSSRYWVIEAGREKETSSAFATRLQINERTVRERIKGIMSGTREIKCLTASSSRKRAILREGKLMRSTIKNNAHNTAARAIFATRYTGNTILNPLLIQFIVDRAIIGGRHDGL